MDGKHYGAYRKMFTKLAGEINGKMLVCPCGTGEEIKILSKLGKRNIVGCNKSKGMVGEAKKKNLDVEVINAEIEKLPFGNVEFDTVICINGFKFFEDSEKAISELARVVSCRIIIGAETPKQKEDNSPVKIIKPKLAKHEIEYVTNGFRAIGWNLQKREEIDIDGNHSLVALVFSKNEKC